MILGLNISTLQNRGSSSKIDIYEMDEEEFEFRFSISKSDYFGEDMPEQVVGVPIGRQRRVPYDDLPDKQLVEEKVALLGDKKNNNAEKKEEKPVNVKAPDTPDKKPKVPPTANKSIQETPDTNIDLLDARKKAYKESLIAGKDFNLYIKGLTVRTRGKMQRSQINLLKRAVDRQVKEQNIKVGSEEWVKIIKSFFPAAPVSIKVPKASTRDNKQTKPVEGIQKRRNA